MTFRNGKHSHLPDIPSEKEISSNNGMEIGKMQTLLLKKVEEQTLYIFELQRQIDELRKEIHKTETGK